MILKKAMNHNFVIYLYTTIHIRVSNCIYNTHGGKGGSRGIVRRCLSTTMTIVHVGNFVSHTPMEMQFSSPPAGNLTMNLEPAFSSESLSGRNLQTTLMLSSAAISRSLGVSIAIAREEATTIPYARVCAYI